MKAFQIIIDFITSFVITAGGSMFVALSASEGRPLSNTAILLVVGTGLVAAAKGTRALVSLPPLSNGNYDTLTTLLKNQPPKKDENEPH